MRRILQCAVGGILITLPAVTLAKDFGTLGKTWNIMEIDMLDTIETRLTAKQNEWQQLQERRKDVAFSYATRPPVVKGVSPISEERSRLFDPSVIVEQDILDHRGWILIERGTLVNPLDVRPFPTTMIFIDGDDRAEVEWALSHRILEKPITIVLLDGSPIELMRQHTDVRFYFDQNGFLVDYFGITQHPARVRQEGNMLVIEELYPRYQHVIALKPLGDELHETH